MGFEQIKPLTEEEREKAKKQIIDQGELLKDGANIREDGSMEVTKEQLMNARLKMESEKGFYKERGIESGIEVSVAWDPNFGAYSILFPQIDYSKMTHIQGGIYTSLIKINKDSELAKQVFDKAIELAKQGYTLEEVHEEVISYINLNIEKNL